MSALTDSLLFSPHPTPMCYLLPTLLRCSPLPAPFPPTFLAVVEMLKALHSLQKENQRLQEQIMTLAAKKERLQLLNVQLSVPFPVVTTSNGPSCQAQYILASNGKTTGKFLSCGQDSFIRGTSERQSRVVIRKAVQYPGNWGSNLHLVMLLIWWSQSLSLPSDCSEDKKGGVSCMLLWVRGK